MRKFLFMILFALVSGTMLQAQQKMGYLNSAVIIAELDEVKAANKELEALRDQKAKVLENMSKQLQDKAVALEQKKQQGTISPKDYEAQMKNLQAEQDKIIKLQESGAQELEKRRQELLEPILNRFNEATKAVAKEKGLSYIFDTSTGILLYGDDSLDVADAVKAKYNALKQQGQK